MAAVTKLGTETWNTTSGTKTVTATPAVNDLIVIVFGHSGNTADPGLSDDQSGTYTIVEDELTDTSASRFGIAIRNSLVSSAVSTVFTTAPGTTTGGGLVVLKVTGMTFTGGSADRQVGRQAFTTAATPTVPMDSGAILTGNAVIGAVYNQTNPAGLTPPGSFTERSDNGFNTPSRGLETASRDSGETGSTITWGSASASSFAAVVVELDTSSSLSLTGTVFTKAGTFPTGAVTATYDLTGTTFTKAGTFPTGAITSVRDLAGATFTKAPTFPQGAITATRDLTGVTFQKAPTFPTGDVGTGAQPLTGTTFTKAGTFPQGAITSTYALTGVTFTRAPTFPTGTVAPGAVNLAGVVFTKAGTFPTGTVTLAGAPQTLTGTVFTKAGTFPTGVIALVGADPDLDEPFLAVLVGSPLTVAALQAASTTTATLLLAGTTSAIIQGSSATTAFTTQDEATVGAKQGDERTIAVKG